MRLGGVCRNQHFISLIPPRSWIPLASFVSAKGEGEWYFIETLLNPDEGEHLGKKLEVEKGTDP
jgi:hypothetical protein